MKSELLSLLSFAIGIAAYTVSQLQQHGKLKWTTEGVSFWGKSSDLKKYKWDFVPVDAPNNWYYRFFKIKYKERFPLSATALVFLTDGYHFCQFLFLLFISLSVVPLLNWTYGIAFWILAHIIHWAVYRFLQR